jgi:hypothetical protein
MNTKTIIKGIKKNIAKIGFTEQGYRLPDTAIESETSFFTAPNYEIYLHCYECSVSFFIRDNVTKEVAKFEVWNDKFKIEKSYQKSEFNRLFDKILKKTVIDINGNGK